MKKKRIIFALVLVFSMVGSMTVMAASVSKTFTYNSESHVNGYISFLEGPLTIQDKVYYTASLGGKDISKCTVAYKVIVDNSTITSGVLNPSNPSVSASDVKVGYGHEYAKLQFDFNGTTKTLTSYAD